MKRSRVIALLLVVSVHVAYAAPRTVLVLRSEGTADTASRQGIDAHVLRLAKTIDGKIDAGDITLTEAAAMVGCSPSEGACRDEVLLTLGVDEVVATTATAIPGGVNITVRRISRSGAPRVAQTTVPLGKAPEAKINADLGPLFGHGFATTALTDKPTDKVTDKPTDKAIKPADKALDEPFPADPPPADTSTARVQPEVTAAPAGQVTAEEEPPSRRTQKIGMAVGAGFVLLSFIMWQQASSKQAEIDAAPLNSPTDFARVQDLESEGDALAGAGNVFFVAGVLVGGVSGYLFWRKGRQASSSRQAQITPVVFPGGGGVTLTLGGVQ